MTKYPFIVDVFLFRMVYCKILFKRDLFDDCKKIEILGRLKNSKRPNYLQIIMSWSNLLKNVGT